MDWQKVTEALVYWFSGWAITVGFTLCVGLPLNWLVDRAILQFGRWITGPDYGI